MAEKIDINDILDGNDVKIDKKTKKAAKKLAKNNLGGIISLVKDLSNPDLSDNDMQSKFNAFMFGLLNSAKKEAEEPMAEIIELPSEDNSTQN